MSERQKNFLRKLCELSEEMAKAYKLAKGFCSMLRQLRGEDLDKWMRAVDESGIVELGRFVESIRKDEAAVQAGLSLHWSNGQTEGQVHRLKLLRSS